MAERFCRRQADAVTTKSCNTEPAVVALHEEVANSYFAIQSLPKMSVSRFSRDGNEQQHPNQDFGN